MGSLFAALTTAVSGLNAQSSAIGNISDNLANSSTTGYKSVGTQFEELVTASNAAVNNPGGVHTKPQYQNDVQGAITSSNTATSLAISGAGYFAVETASTDANGNTSFNGNTYYTRSGDFTLDKNGYIVNGSGYYLTGYSINPDGSTNTSTTAPIQISALLNDPVKTANISYAANLPSNAAVGYTSPAATLLVYDALGGTHTANYTWTKTATNKWDLNVSVPQATDANGKPFSATIPYTFNDGTGGTTAGTIGAIGTYTANTPAISLAAIPDGTFKIGNASIPWSEMTGTVGSTVNVSLSNADGSTTIIAVPITATSPSTTIANAATNMRATLNALGTLTPTSSPALATSFGLSGLSAGGSGAAITLSPVALNITANSGGTATQVTYTNAGTDGITPTDGKAQIVYGSAYTPPTTTGAGTAINIAGTLNFSGTGAQTLSFNFGTFNGSSGVTQFSDTNSAVSVSNFSQDGLAKGSFNSVAIDKNGFVSLNYSNGTNKVIAQIPLVQFYAEDQLQRVTGGAYQSTIASGSPRVGSPGTQGAGTLSSNSLEQSNVDIATEFTKLIQAQQIYSANAKVVTTDNSLLQVTLNMVQ